MSLMLGCIADDFTGATDLANTLTRQGMCTVVLLGVPRAGFEVPDADAVVIALKSRSNPSHDAVRMSLAALDWLRQAGARQFYFKYCSTFDSTDAGNIGPVADALLDTLLEPFTIACPAFPANARTVYQGYLFAGGTLLSESSMRDHPLTPMTDPSLQRILQRQTPGRVALIPFSVVDRGSDAIAASMSALQAQGYRYAIVDALTDEHLFSIGSACAGMRLLTGGSGLAVGLPNNFRRQGLLRRRVGDSLPHVEGAGAVLAGSCSAATLRQVEAMKVRCEWFELDPAAIVRDSDPAAAALQCAKPRLGGAPLLIYSSADAERVSAVQEKLGREAAGTLLENALARIAKGLVAAGVRRMVVAGGETSGAVVSALGVEGLRVGREIDPGVPWTASIAADPVLLALKSGNFGTDDFFLKAFDRLQ